MQRLIKGACTIAAEEIGKEKADRIAEAAQKRYEEFLVATSYYSIGIKMMLSSEDSTVFKIRHA